MEDKRAESVNLAEFKDRVGKAVESLGVEHQGLVRGAAVSFFPRPGTIGFVLRDAKFDQAAGLAEALSREVGQPGAAAFTLPDRTIIVGFFPTDDALSL